MTPAPPAPPAAGPVFGDRLLTAQRYADLLADEASVRGLIGPAELPRLWDRHLLNSAVLGELIGPDVQVIDIGSGAGLPGIPLAIARPDLTVLLVEPLLRRSTWLADVVARLELGNVQVRRARAEELAGQVAAPVVTARAVAPLERLATWCLPLVAVGGELLAMKGQSAAAELARAEAHLRALGAASWELVPVGRGSLLDQTSVVRVRVGTTGAADRVSTGSATGPARPVRSRRRRPQPPDRRTGQPGDGQLDQTRQQQRRGRGGAA